MQISMQFEAAAPTRTCGSAGKNVQSQSRYAAARTVADSLLVNGMADLPLTGDRRSSGRSDNRGD